MLTHRHSFQIENTLVPEECPAKTKKGDKLSMHYTGTLKVQH